MEAAPVYGHEMVQEGQRHGCPFECEALEFGVNRAQASRESRAALVGQRGVVSAEECPADRFETQLNVWVPHMESPARNQCLVVRDAQDSIRQPRHSRTLKLITSLLKL
jgi:hypothetical protein